MARLAGGVDALAEACKTEKDLQWRLELCDQLIALGHDSAPVIKAETLEQLAEAEINATARNTYLWSAKQLRAC